MFVVSVVIISPERPRTHRIWSGRKAFLLQMMRAANRDASKTCTTPEDCQKSAGLHLPSPICPNGYVFCLSVGGCVEGSCPDVSGGGRCDGNKVSCVLSTHLLDRHVPLTTGKDHTNQDFSLSAGKTHSTGLSGTCLFIYFD